MRGTKMRPIKPSVRTTGEGRRRGNRDMLFALERDHPLQPAVLPGLENPRVGKNENAVRNRHGGGSEGHALGPFQKEPERPWCDDDPHCVSTPI